MTTRILVVDDHPLFRQGLSMALSETEDLVVCGEGTCAQDAVDLSRDLKPDVVLLDLSMPGGGFTALEHISASQPAMRVAVLTASEDCDDVLKAMKLGARGYILKGVGGNALIDAVRDIARGAGHVAPTLGAAILSGHNGVDGRFDTNKPDADDTNSGRLAHLTPREAHVLKMVAAGYSNKEIARQGGMQEKTVKHHVTRILQKLRVRNRTEAAMVLRSVQPAG